MEILNSLQKQVASNIDDFMIRKDKSLLDALVQIDNNLRRFLMVTDNEKVVGTITDGDIRRFLIKGNNLNHSIDEVYLHDFIYVTNKDKLSDVIELFKKYPKIEFIPILREDKRLFSLITRNILHALLLQNADESLCYDFLKIDEYLPINEIYNRPWGYYKSTVLNDSFQSKIIVVRPQSSLSLQYHIQREEHWVIVNGYGIATIGESTMTVKPGDHFFIPKSCLHRIENTSDSENLTIVEVQLGEYFGEDDIIRIDDIYGRCNNDNKENF